MGTQSRTFGFQEAWRAATECQARSTGTS